MSIFSETLRKMIDGGICMLPILLVSTLMFGLILLRAFRLYYSFADLRRQENTGHFGMPLSLWLMELGLQYRKSRSGITEIDSELADKLCAGFVSRLGTGGATILVCASLATLLGLLGTVSGMISSFDSLNVCGTGNVKAMAGGISEALITTQSGLVIGVAGFLAGRVLLGFNRILLGRTRDYCRMLEDSLAGGAR